MIYNCYEEGGLLYLVYSKNGKLLKEVANFKPSIFLPSSHETKYKTIYGDHCRKVTFKGVSDYHAKIWKLRNDGDIYHGDIQPKYQFLIEKFLNKKITHDKVIKIYNYDIEAFSLKDDRFVKQEVADEPIRSITIQEYHTGKYYVFGTKAWDLQDVEIKNKKGEVKKVVSKDKIVYYQSKSEVHMLRKFIKFLDNKSVQVITGWNIISYDNQYMFNRLRILGIEKKFTDACVENRDGVLFGKMQNLDYQLVYQKMEKDPKPSYTLNYTANDRIDMVKNDMESFRDQFVNHYQEFIAYNIADTALVGFLEDALQYLKLMFSMSSDFRCLPEDILHVTRYWNTFIYSYALSQNIVVPRMQDRPKIPYVGGYVKKPIPGQDEWGTLYDVQSSYTTNNRRYNISPETLVSFNTLPKELYKLTCDCYMSMMEKTFHKHKYAYKTAKGSKSLITNLKKPPENKSNVLTLNHQFINNRDILDRVQYPHFFIMETDKKIKEGLRIKKLEANRYLFFAKSKIDFLKNTQNRDSTFQGYNSMIVVNHTFLTLDLIEYFSKDYKRFLPFTPEIKKNNYIMTPNLQFFRKTKELGILPKTQEIVFFERLEAKNRKKVDDSLIAITQKFLDEGMFITRESLIELGMNIIPKEQRNELIRILKTKDEQTVKDAHEKYLAQKVVDAIEDISKKIAINGVYGATANEKFRFNDIRLCESTTSTGQLALRGCMNHLENDDLITWIYCDTDSVRGDTLISTEYGDIPIENIWEGSYTKTEYSNGKHIAETPPTRVLSYNKERKEIERKYIKYVMKHKVKKRMFKIIFNHIETIVTEDHSVIIDRDGDIIDIKPGDIKPTDKLIHL